MLWRVAPLWRSETVPCLCASALMAGRVWRQCEHTGSSDLRLASQGERADAVRGGDLRGQVEGGPRPLLDPLTARGAQISQGRKPRFRTPFLLPGQWVAECEQLVIGLAGRRVPA